MPSARALRPTAAWSTSTPSSAIRWAAGGPTSISGPASPTAHQQAYIDWVYRAYHGGLRLIICSIVHNEALASASGGSGPRDDRGAIVAQAEAAKEMIAVQERRAGGPGLAWLQIAYSPAEARSIIAAGRLAVVLGVEVDSLGNWRRFEDLHEKCGRDLVEARRLISAELDWLCGLGIRQIAPVHLTDNGFGGTAIYRRLFDASNMVLTGRHFKVNDGWHSGVRFRLEHDAKDSLARLVALQGRRLSPERYRKTGLLRRLPVVKGLLQALEAPPVPGGHINPFGLTKYGVILLEEMMERGMVIDLEHMSQRAADVAPTIAESREYPVICSHVWFRDLFFTADVPYAPEHAAEYGTSDVLKVGHEGAMRADQIELVGRLGGMVGPILNQGDLAGPARALPELAGRFPPRCAGSSTAWAEAYLYALAKMSGRGVAIAQFKAGFNPSVQAHPADDRPAGAGVQQERVDNFTTGLWAAAEERGSRRTRQPEGWPAEQWAAYLAYPGQAADLGGQPRTRELIEKVQGIWKRWQAMDGPNAPLSRCTAGPRHDYDFNGNKQLVGYSVVDRRRLQPGRIGMPRLEDALFSCRGET